MTLTRDFKQTVQARSKRDPAFRRALLGEAIATFLGGEVDTGKAVLRDFINATLGFSQLAALTSIPAKSLMRMLGPSGNPNARNLFAILVTLQIQEGVFFELKEKRPLKTESPRQIEAKIRRAIKQLDRGEGIPENRLDAYLAQLKAKPESARR